MSRPEVLRIDSLRAMLRREIGRYDKREGTLYLRTLGCCLLTCDDENKDERVALCDVFETQALIENIDAGRLLDAILVGVVS